MPVLYPDGYATRLVTLGQLESLHGLRMHPEYRRRLFRWIESMGGHIGIGGGWRATGTQPDKPGFAEEGKSFHQSQTFRSGLVAYAAVDLVARTGGVHRAPTWGESETAPAYGLHTFITGEPWHMQCIEMRGWQTWVNAGRPDPKRIAIPGDEPPDEDDMPRFMYIAKPPAGSPADWPWLVVADADVRAAITSDTQRGLEEVTIADPGQYLALRKSAGV